MTQLHPNIIIRTALKSKLENYTIPFSEEHWLQLENIIIAQPKSVVIKTPTLALQIFYSALLLTTILCILFYPVKPFVKPLPPKYLGDTLFNFTKKNNKNLQNSKSKFKAFFIPDSLKTVISLPLK